MYPPTHILANHLLWAMKGSATNEQTLIDILVSMNATEKKEVKTLFKAKAGQSLRSYVSSDTSGELRNILNALIDANRPDEECVDVAKAKNDAAFLRQKMVEMQTNSYCVKCKNHTATFHRILASRSWAHLKVTFAVYYKTFGRPFRADIPKFFEGWYTEALTCIHLYAVDSNRFFARALRRDVKMYQNNSWGYAYGVARVFTWRSEIDLGDIVKTFKRQYSKTKTKTLSKHVWYYTLGFLNADATRALVAILH